MSSPYQKVQPHFPNLSMKEIECLIGDTWDFYCQRDPETMSHATAYMQDIMGTPQCLFWTEEKWLHEINRLQESRRSELPQ